ncbi:MAG: AtpZ/AtpI family protein [Bacteroidetes bacterium]|nr:AtpZ/AtpI family protein [Bacteroidota bacterium]
MEEKKYKLDKPLAENSVMLTAGIQLAAGVLIFFFLGLWLDKKFNYSPWLTIIFSFVGGIGSVYKFIKTALSISEKSSKVQDD